MKIAVCDDCQQDVMQIKTFFDREHDVALYTDARNFIADIEEKKTHFDLYLIDIYMDTINGIDVAKRIRERDEDAVICFISSSDAFYRQAYDLYAVQYLLKPIQREKVEKLVTRVSQQISRDKAMSLQFRSRGQMGSVPYRKILFISSREHTIFVQCRDGNIQKFKGKLSEIALRVCGDTFFRCHQSFIVNMYHIDRLHGNEIFMSGYRIPVSRRYLPEVRRRYQEILFEEMD
jgi:Response regulator of the LytR/AlgR family